MACLRELPDIFLDGELVVLDDQGKPQFERLARRARMKLKSRINMAVGEEPAVLFAFDCLSLKGKDLRGLPLLKRKKHLSDAVGASQRVRAVQYVGEQGLRVYDAAAGLQLEGIVAKRGDSTYKAGRSRDWLKIRTPMAGTAKRYGRSAGWDARVPVQPRLPVERRGAERT